MLTNNAKPIQGYYSNKNYIHKNILNDPWNQNQIICKPIHNPYCWFTDNALWYSTQKLHSPSLRIGTRSGFICARYIIAHLRKRRIQHDNSAKRRIQYGLWKIVQNYWVKFSVNNIVFDIWQYMWMISRCLDHIPFF